MTRTVDRELRDGLAGDVDGLCRRVEDLAGLADAGWDRAAGFPLVEDDWLRLRWLAGDLRDRVHRLEHHLAEAGLVGAERSQG
jgi:hypothetical protein